MSELGAFLLLGAFFWRITPLSMGHQNWVGVVISLLFVYFWFAVLVAALYLIKISVS